MTGNEFMFLGFDLDDELRELLDRCREQDRVYLEEEAYLETVTVDDRQLIGKRVDSGARIDQIDDATRNVVSLLQRVTGGAWPSGERPAQLLAVDPAEPTPEPGAPEGEGEFDYSDLVN